MPLTIVHSIHYTMYCILLNIDMASNREKILGYIREKGQASVVDLLVAADIGRAMIHRHLKSLVDEGLIRKVGSSPKVLYVPIEKTADRVSESKSFFVPSNTVIDEHFLLITPQGERIEGSSGFAKWCADRQYDLDKKTTEYVTLSERYTALKKDGLLDGTEKLKGTFGDDTAIDRVYYIDFYAWEIFGKTKLGQLLLYAKQSQDRKMIREISEVVRPHLDRLIGKYGIDAIGYIPPTVRRSVQLMDMLKKNIHATIPELAIEKMVGEVRVPQKTLSKLSDRIANACGTMFVTDKRAFGTVLLIDDAVGSGATLNEVAKKIKAQGVAKKVICLAITGSLKGFDVISEV